MGWLPLARYAVVGDDGMAAVVAAARLRRVGISVVTFLSGNEKKQRRKAIALAVETITVDQANDIDVNEGAWS